MRNTIPKLDGRSASELYDEITAIASTTVPDWRRAEIGGDFATALFKLVGQLGEHVTGAIAKTPTRDEVAFFDMLDIPAESPRPATAPLVFLLTEQLDAPVFAPARTQAAANADDGEALFEMKTDLNLTPGRLMFIAATDGEKDTIELQPPGFSSLEAPTGQIPSFTVASFAAPGSETLQVEPIEGLNKGDVIRLDGFAYSVKKNDEGLLTLDPGLDQNAEPGTILKKVSQFDPFTLRNQQRHALYIGHDELFALEEPSIIRLQIDPPIVASTLAQGEVEWSMYGIRQGAEGWHPVAAVVDQPGLLKLTKAWRGSVEKSNEPGEENLWLRAHFSGPIQQAAIGDSTTQSISIRVETSKATPSSGEEFATERRCFGGSARTVDASDPEPDSSTAPIEGSNTIDKAFHNAEPLPLTSRFLPFGPEPRRFDTFAIAAPEAFSKKGAKVEIDVKLSDATIQAMDATHIFNGPERAYTIGTNGRLQIIVLSDEIVWQELGQPMPANILSGDAESRELVLAGNTSPQAVQVRTQDLDIPDSRILDLVVVRDLRGRLWASVVEISAITTTPTPIVLSWTELDMVPGEKIALDFVLYTDSSDQHFLFGNSDGQFRVLALTVNVPTTNLSAGTWNNVNVSFPGNPEPIFKPDSPLNFRLIPVLPADWPTVSTAIVKEIMVLDANGELWSGTISDLTVSWVKLVSTGMLAIPRADASVRPVAAHLSDGRVVVFAATLTNPRRMFVVDDNGKVIFSDVMANTVDIVPGSSIHCYPGALGPEPLAVGSGHDAGTPSMIVWTSEGELFTRALPDDAPVDTYVPRGIITSNQGAPVVIANGSTEHIYKLPLAEAVDFELFHALVLSSQVANVDLLELPSRELADFPNSFQVMGLTAGNSVYRYDGPLAGVGTYSLWQIVLPFIGQTTAQPNELVLEVGHNLGDSELEIHRQHYTIQLVTEGIATLDHPLPAIYTGQPVPTDVPYNTLNTGGSHLSVDVLPEHISALVNVSRGNTPPLPPLALLFSSDSTPPDPRLQAIVRNEVTGGEDWVLLGNSWTLTPGGTVTTELLGVDTEAWIPRAYERGYQNPELAWEYYDGRGWRSLEQDFVDRTDHFASSGSISFTAPNDLAAGEVAGQEDLWIRARLIGGDYGSAEYIVKTTEPNDDDPPVSTQTVTVNTANLRPPEIFHIEACFTLETAVPPQKVLVTNNLTLRDQTQANQVLDAEFELFEGVHKINGSGDQQAGNQQVLYLGFSKNFASGTLSFFVDAEDQFGDVALQFEIYRRDRWHRVTHTDETRGFLRRGYVRVSVDHTPLNATLFGQDLYWLRVRPRLPGAWMPKLRGLYVNAAPSEQAESVVQELLGSSTGESGLEFSISKIPVLPDSLELRIQETLTDEERTSLLADSEDVDESEKPVTKYPDLSLDDDWVLWKRVDSFIGERPEARVYRLDPLTGTVRFGSDTKPPPPGQDNVRAIRYQTGGGIRGNVDAFAVDTLNSALDGIDTVTNPIRAAGGTDTPVDEIQVTNAPARIRRASQALTPPDIEALALSTSPLIVRARCLFPEASGRPIRLALAVNNGEACPRPTLERRDAVSRIVREQGWGALTLDELCVSGPDYLRAKLEVRLRASTIDQAAALENAARKRLRLLLNPIKGGPDNRGWPFARPLYRSDVLRALAPLPGFDRVESMKLEAIEGSFEQMSPLSMICALTEDVMVSVVLGGGG